MFFYVCLMWPLGHLDMWQLYFFLDLSPQGVSEIIFSPAHISMPYLYFLSRLIQRESTLWVLSVLSSHLEAQTWHLSSNFLTFHVAYFAVGPLSMAWGYLEFTSGSMPETWQQAARVWTWAAGAVGTAVLWNRQSSQTR